MPSQLLQSFQGLTEYLRSENVLMEEKRKEKRSSITAFKIAESFQKVDPDADENTYRKLAYELIQNAAKMNTLKEDLPLISNLYSDSLKNLELSKQRKEDIALKGYAGEQGFEGPKDISGLRMIDLMKFESEQERLSERQVSQILPTGENVLSVYKKGSTVPKEQYMIDARSTEQKLSEKLREHRAAKEIDYEFQSKMDRANRYSPMGMTQGGLPVSFDRKTGTSYIPQTLEDGTVIQVPLGSEGPKLVGKFKTKAEEEKAATNYKQWQVYRKDAYVQANGLAANVLEAMGQPVIKEDVVTAFNKLSGIPETEIIRKINLKMSKKTQEERDMIINQYQQFKETKQEHDLASRKLTGMAPKLELFEKLDKYKMDLDTWSQGMVEYKEFYLILQIHGIKKY